MIHDIVYVPGGSSQQQLDVYLPGGAGPAYPTLLLVHGGGAGKESMSALAQHFTESGYAVIVPDFRDTATTRYPEPVADTFCVLAWIHANAAAYRLDTEHVDALGHSLGATFAAMLAAVDDPAPYLQNCPASLPGTARLRRVVGLTGIYDYPALAGATGGMRTYLNRYLGAAYTDAPGAWQEASPATYVNGDEPPFLLIHGEKDINIDPEQSRAFAAVLQAAGVPVDLVLVPGADHTALLRDATVIERAGAFLAAP